LEAGTVFEEDSAFEEEEDTAFEEDTALEEDEDTVANSWGYVNRHRTTSHDHA